MHVWGMNRSRFLFSLSSLPVLSPPSLHLSSFVPPLCRRWLRFSYPFFLLLNLYPSSLYCLSAIGLVAGSLASDLTAHLPPLPLQPHPSMAPTLHYSLPRDVHPPMQYDLRLSSNYLSWKLFTSPNAGMLNSDFGSTRTRGNYLDVSVNHMPSTNQSNICCHQSLL